MSTPSAQSQFDRQDTGPEGRGWQSELPGNQPLPAPGAIQPTQTRGRGSIVGVARNIQQTSEQFGFGGGRSGGSLQGVQILRFRLELYNDSGDRIGTKDVEMRSRSITGFITDGDQVEVVGRMQDGLVRAKQVRNLRNGAMIQGKGIGAPTRVFVAIIACLALGILITVGILFTSTFNRFAGGGQQVPTFPTFAPIPTFPPNQPTVAPDQPAVAPNQPAVAPNQPTATPNQPAVAPNQPTATPNQPTATP